MVSMLRDHLMSISARHKWRCFVFLNAMFSSVGIRSSGLELLFEWWTEDIPIQEHFLFVSTILSCQYFHLETTSATFVTRHNAMLGLHVNGRLSAGHLCAYGTGVATSRKQKSSTAT